MVFCNLSQLHKDERCNVIVSLSESLRLSVSLHKYFFGKSYQQETKVSKKIQFLLKIMHDISLCCFIKQRILIMKTLRCKNR